MNALIENKTILTVKTCILQIYNFILSATIPATPLVSKRTRAGFLFLKTYEIHKTTFGN